ncbi:MAG: recombinase family protein, partial [bacterium]
MKTKFFLYARKSTEDEERQIMSIEAQIAELREYAEKEKIEILEEFIESKSAKKPGREIFNRMIDKIKQSKEAIGLLAWHPDRLARNSIDGGQIIYLIDTENIASLRFPTFWFEPTPQGLFMLQVAFGQSKYYSDNLSQNVKRGMRQKLRRGEWPTLAPLGYVNNPKTRNIEPDSFKARAIKKAFDEFSQGKHTLKSLSNRLSFWGVESKTGKPLCKATLKLMLTNKVYLGIIVQNGESYEGCFPAIISGATFEKVQQILKERAKPRKSKKGHDFPFTGLMRCGECGAAITAQYAHGNGGTYRYYRCTKRLGPCSQGYLREEPLADQLRDKISKVALCEDWKEKMLAQVDIWEKEGAQSSQSSAQNLKKKIKDTEQKLDKLVNAFLDGIIEKDIYLQKKDELIKTKVELLQKKTNFGRKGNNWIEPLRNWINDAHHAGELALSKDLPEIKSFVKKIGTNRRLLDKTFLLDLEKPWSFLFSSEGDSGNSEKNGELRSPNFFENRATSLKWSGWADLNRRPLRPER